MRRIFLSVLVIGIVVLSLASVACAETLEPIVLWPNGAPGAEGNRDRDVPQIVPWIPEQGNGAALVVAPGGGYGGLTDDHEGKQIAEWLNSHGIAAFVLRYRHGPHYGHPYPWLDAQRAIRTVRVLASEWGIDPDKIGMVGFSAGGHLTATMGTQNDVGDVNSQDPVERFSSRPDFLVLGYPVITMTDPHTHRGSRRNLLGTKPSAEMIEKMSAENNVTAETPPTFLFHTTEDKSVDVENPIGFYLALQEHEVPTEFHIYEQGRHGLGLAKDNPAMSAWPDQCITWLKVRGFLE
ncbi:MAG: alpha/beta hydrolase [Candidatus Hydrogenedentota bacterium]